MKEVNLKIQFTNRAVYSFVAFGLFVICVLGVYAYNSGASPAVMGHSGEEIHVSVNGETKLLNDVVEELSFTCPSGFTKVENQGYVLGCIQNDEEGSANPFTATDVCLTKYGGRLPGFSEWFLGLNNSDLSNEIDDYEWIDTSFNTLNTICGDGALTNCNAAAYTNDRAYRCFIPAH